jgi:hypothetical protein
VHPALFQYNHYITSVTTQQTIRRFATRFGYAAIIRQNNMITHIHTIGTAALKLDTVLLRIFLKHLM